MLKNQLENMSVWMYDKLCDHCPRGSDKMDYWEFVIHRGTEKISWSHLNSTLLMQ